MSTSVSLLDSLLDLLSKQVTKTEEKEDENCDECVNNILHGTPLDAFNNGAREELLYVTATRTDQNSDGQDFVAVVDVNPNSNNYCSIIQELDLGINEEVHHSGWNACASCYGSNTSTRKYLVVPSFTSGNIHIIDTSDKLKLRLHKTISGEMIKEKYGLSYPHTPHCLANGNLLISFLGIENNNKTVDFLLINGETFDIIGKWILGKKKPKYNYDYWYQPFHNIMISSEWGTPNAFSKGFNLDHVKNGLYGHSIHLWDWEKRTLIKSFDFDKSKVIMPLETRFLHDPKSCHAFVGCALSSNMIHIYKDNKTNEWKANEEYIRVKGVEMENWILPNMPSLISDFLISMDDKYIYLANWFHGDIRQYNITDIFNPKLTGQVFIGGLLHKNNKYGYKMKDTNNTPTVPDINNTIIRGGAQMIQLSLDGKRLYVTNSLFSAYDKQFYPNLMNNGGQILLIDCDHKNGGMKLNKDFIVDFGKSKNGPARPHEMRYPGGDCTSDIFLVQN